MTEHDEDDIPQEQPTDDRPFNPFRAPKTAKAQGVVADVLGQLQSYERHKGLRQRQRKPSDQATLETTVAALVCDLMHRFITKPSGWVSVSLSNQDYQRHGSPFKQSYTGKELAPYRRAALKWLKANSELFWVKNAIDRVRGLYQSAGPHIEAFRLRGLSPQDRAKAHWARMRKAEIDPAQVVAAWLAVEMIIADDPQPVTTPEFRRVQAAKIVHRMASGTHKRWEREVPDPNWSGLRSKTLVEEKHWYPRSRGRVLRHIGEDIEQAVELLAQHHLAEIKACMAGTKATTSP